MGTLMCWLFRRRPATIFHQLDELRFFIEDEEHIVKTENVSPDTTLNNYLRENAHLTGTKYMCLEGGCGACIVAATITDPLTLRKTTLAVNSCLVPIYLCSGWKIHTSETIAHANSGHHPVQKALVQFNGTQCGYCSPGMVMNMYALYESGEFTMKDVENSFGGNICRCTGYRPILSAFKSLAVDASAEILGKCIDIEDIYKESLDKCRSKCTESSVVKPQPYYYEFDTARWITVFSIQEILSVLRGVRDHITYMLVSGNTAMGVYRRTKEPDLYIDITRVKALVDYTINKDDLILGANMTLTNTMDLFYTLAKENDKFYYLEKMADHIDLVAQVPVRNLGTLAGNLYTKHQHQEFPSDIYLILETVGATLTIVGPDQRTTTINLVDFLSFDMRRKIIKNITLPALDRSYVYESYKILPRAQNAHALVNAGFLLKLNSTNKVKSARIVYGAINPAFTHAKNAEDYLTGKNLFQNDTLQELFQTLNTEIVPNHVLTDPSPDYRKKIAIALCYKFILSIAPVDQISARNKSGGLKLIRPISRGTQDYETNKSIYPLTEPISKLEALAQCTGQAQYIMDMPDQPGQLHAAFVLAKAPANTKISRVDATEALKLDGVIAYYGKHDIPGENNFMPSEANPTVFTQTEEIFCSGVVKYYFQPVGLVVATCRKLAQTGADMVQISYVESDRKPLLTIRDILAENRYDKVFKAHKVEAKIKGADVQHVIQGTFNISWQYHYTMETQCCVVIPTEDGLDMYPSTQCMNYAQVAAAKALNIPVNRINIVVRRLGGGYGAKISRNSLVSCAAALAAYKLQKPVKLSMPFETNMNVMGKRRPFFAEYEAGVDDQGGIQYLNASLYTDLGSEGGNEYKTSDITQAFGKAYKQEGWNYTVYFTKSDSHTGTYCRAPSTTETVVLAETIMEHIATELNLDPINVRFENCDRSKPQVAKYLDELIRWANVEKRRQEIHCFNKDNRWVKRGMAVVPMLFPIDLSLAHSNVIVSVYEGDGSVSVAHGGIEMGQGINTKAAQMCAYALGISLDQVSIKPSNVLITPNARFTGTSFTSESMCYAILKACEILKQRMKPVRDKLRNSTWPQLVRQCFLENVDLIASYFFHGKLPEIHPYSIYGATCAEVEIDILTGLYQIKRVDLLEDAGDSISPEIDIGQVEGAFIMGMGYWTTEQLIFSPEGELLTNRTWYYKPPGAKDIPIDFRVRFPKHNPNRAGLLKSKATAEPPLCMSCSIPLAIRNALATARIEANPKANKWYPIDGPSTVEDTFMNSLHDFTQYKL